MNTPNSNPSPELKPCRYCGGVGKFQIVSPVSDHAWASCFCSRGGSPQTLPAPGEVERLRQALRNIAEGNLSDLPWQANYARIKEVADEALAAQPATAEPFGYWIEQRLAEPVLLRKPSYIPEPSELRTVTPLYVSPTRATVAAANDEGDWVNHERIRQEAYASGYRQAIDDAAMVADDLNFGTEIGEWLAMTKKDVSARACHECAAAIRLLSQGGGK